MELNEHANSNTMNKNRSHLERNEYQSIIRRYRAIEIIFPILLESYQLNKRVLCKEFGIQQGSWDWFVSNNKTLRPRPDLLLRIITIINGREKK